MKKILVLLFTSLLFFACDNGSKPTDNNTLAPTPTPINTLKEVIINDASQLILRSADLQAKGPGKTNKLMKVVDGQAEETAVEFIGTEGKIDNVNITSLQNLENGFIGMTARDITIQAKGMGYGEIPIFVNQTTNEAFTIKELANGAELVIRDLTAYLKGYKGDYYFNTPYELFKLRFESNIPKVVKVGLNEKITSISNLRIDPNGNLYASEFFMYRDGTLKTKAPEGFVTPSFEFNSSHFIIDGTLKQIKYDVKNNTVTPMKEFNVEVARGSIYTKADTTQLFGINELGHWAMEIFTINKNFELKILQKLEIHNISIFPILYKKPFFFYKNQANETEIVKYEDPLEEYVFKSLIDLPKENVHDFGENWIIYTKENDDFTTQTLKTSIVNGEETTEVLESYTPPTPGDKPLTTITL